MTILTSSLTEYQSMGVVGPIVMLVSLLHMPPMLVTGTAVTTSSPSTLQQSRHTVYEFIRRGIAINATQRYTIMTTMTYVL